MILNNISIKDYRILLRKWCNRQLETFNSKRKVSVLIYNTSTFICKCNVITSVIKVSTAVIELLKENELKAVLAHEMAHSLNIDFPSNDEKDTFKQHVIEFTADKLSLYLGGDQLDLIKALYKLHKASRIHLYESFPSHPSLYKRAHQLNVFCFEKEEEPLLWI